MAGMTLLAADQLDWYVGKPWAMIIDVRNRREYEKGLLTKRKCCHIIYSTREPLVSVHLTAG